jgi:hypothetical protein
LETEQGDTTAAIVALCDGWPKADVLQSIWARYKNGWRVPTAIAFELLSACSPPERLLEALQKAVTRLQGAQWDCYRR